MSTLLVELIYIVVNTSMCFNFYDFDLIYFILTHNTIVKW